MASLALPPALRTTADSISLVELDECFNHKWEQGGDEPDLCNWKKSSGHRRPSMQQTAKFVNDESVYCLGAARTDCDLSRWWGRSGFDLS